MPVDRRQFLTGLGAAGAATLAGCTLIPPEPEPKPPPPAGTGRPPAATLVIVFQYGGNDGLNTVIPYGDATYRSARGALALGSADGVLTLAEGFALHPSLARLKAHWDAGRVAIVRGVGYPDPDLSHFRSTDIWHSGRPDAVIPTGWIGRWLDGASDPLQAIAVSSTLPRMFRGAQQTGIAVPGNQFAVPGTPTFRRGFAALATQDGADPTWAQAIVRSEADLLRAEAVLNPVLAAPPPAGTALASVQTGLGRQLATVAQLVRAPTVPARVYTVGIGGWDTHADQRGTHARLLTEVDNAVGAFVTDMAAHPRGRGVVVMVMSEFGRRVNANGNNGTDHGTANNVLLAGAPVNGGFYGTPPSLTNLDGAGNMKMTTDFRSVYATVLARVLGSDPVPVLNGSFPALNFV